MYWCWRIRELTKFDNRKINKRLSGHNTPYKFIAGCPISKTCLVHMFSVIWRQGSSLWDWIKKLDGFMVRDADESSQSTETHTSNMSPHAKLCYLQLEQHPPLKYRMSPCRVIGTCQWESKVSNRRSYLVWFLQAIEKSFTWLRKTHLSMKNPWYRHDACVVA